MRFLKNLFFGMLVLFSAGISFSQDITKHEWKDRVLLVLSDNFSKIESQLQLLKKDVNGLKERKLVVYQIMPNSYKKGLESTIAPPSNTIYVDMKKKEDNFEIVLIGLDGGIKLRQTKLLTSKKLFVLIDSMPMRQAEIRKN